MMTQGNDDTVGRFFCVPQERGHRVRRIEVGTL